MCGLFLLRRSLLESSHRNVAYWRLNLLFSNRQVQFVAQCVRLRQSFHDQVGRRGASNRRSSCASLQTRFTSERALLVAVAELPPAEVQACPIAALYQAPQELFASLIDRCELLPKFALALGLQCRHHPYCFLFSLIL